MSNADKFGTIVICQEPRGRFREHMLTAVAIKPGTNLRLNSTGLYSGGYAGEINIATERGLLGGSVTDDIPASTRVWSYTPLPGDDFLALGLSGEVLNKGTRAAFNAAGKLVAAAAGPLVVDEDAGTLAADTLVIVRLGSTTATTAS